MVGIVSGSLSNFLRANLSSESKEIRTSTEQITSSQKNTRATTDAAGLNIGIGLQVETSTLTTALSNVSQASAVNQITSGAINEIKGLLERSNELAVQANQSVLNDEERGFLQTEFEEVLTSIDTIASTTAFNGTNLTNSNDILEFRVALDGLNTISVNTADLTLSSLFNGLEIPTISTQQDAANALDVISTTFNIVSDFATEVTSTNTLIDTVSDNINVAIQNIEASRSTLPDTDIGDAAGNSLEPILKANITISLQALGNEENIQNTLSLLED